MGGRRPLEIVQGAATHCTSEPFSARLEIAVQWLRSGEAPTTKEVARQLGHGVAASASCVTALYLATRFMHRPFEEMQRFIAACGGDVDTIGAMAGALWGAANGATGLPSGALARLERREELVALATALHARCVGASRAS